MNKEINNKSRESKLTLDIFESLSKDDQYDLVLEYRNVMTHIQTTKKRRKKFYKSQKEIPKKYNNERFGFVNGFLCDLSTGEKMIKNSKSYNTPKYFKFNAQAMWSNGMHHSVRSKIKIKLTEEFNTKLVNLDTNLKTPVSVNFHLITTEQGFDLDNKAYIYQKAFQDCLGSCGIIPDDDVKHLVSFSWTYNLDTESLEENKEVFDLIIAIEGAR